jgi:hypothetical protein
MAIALDVASNSGVKSLVTTFNWSHTCTGSDLVLIVGVGVSDLTGTDRVISSVTYNGTSMTQIENSDGGADNNASWLFYLFNPSTGANTVQVNFNAGTLTNTVGGAVSLTGVDNTGIDAHTNQHTTNADSITTSVTTVADNSWVIDSIAMSSGNVATLTIGGSANQQVNVGTNSFDFGMSTIGPKTPAGSQSMVWNDGGALGSSFDWCHCLVSVRPTGGGGGGTTIKQLAAMGVG